MRSEGFIAPYNKKVCNFDFSLHKTEKRLVLGAFRQQGRGGFLDFFAEGGGSSMGEAGSFRGKNNLLCITVIV